MTTTTSTARARRRALRIFAGIAALVLLALVFQAVAPTISDDAGRASLIGRAGRAVAPPEAQAYNCMHIFNSNRSSGPFWVSKTKDGANTRVDPGHGSGCSGDWFHTGCRYTADKVTNGTRVFGCADTYLGVGWQATTVIVR